MCQLNLIVSINQTNTWLFGNMQIFNIYVSRFWLVSEIIQSISRTKIIEIYMHISFHLPLLYHEASLILAAPDIYILFTYLYWIPSKFNLRNLHQWYVDFFCFFFRIFYLRWCPGIEIVYTAWLFNINYELKAHLSIKCEKSINGLTKDAYLYARYCVWYFFLCFKNWVIPSSVVLLSFYY